MVMWVWPMTVGPPNTNNTPLEMHPHYASPFVRVEFPPNGQPAVITSSGERAPRNNVQPGPHPHRSTPMPPEYLTPARRDLNLPAALRMGIRTPRGPSALGPLKRKGYLPPRQPPGTDARTQGPHSEILGGAGITEPDTSTIPLDLYVLRGWSNAKIHWDLFKKG
ncbi:unnamed protein product [Bemisia tabaci]|uniref:Uncharacterized protein n=1 Tax=Bemisia tabaci TaxID=7038 RepID=A0A9P0AEJ3_BEMTA|nr:unnamed protein product [Bemisia tabaci]